MALLGRTDGGGVHALTMATSRCGGPFQMDRRPEEQFVIMCSSLQGARKRSQVRVVRQGACSFEGVDDDDQ